MASLSLPNEEYSFPNNQSAPSIESPRFDGTAALDKGICKCSQKFFGPALLRVFC